MVRNKGGGTYCQHMKCSLWLVPPPSAAVELQRAITDLSETFAARGASVPFPPHVTIVGRVECDDPVQVAQRLQDELHAFFSSSSSSSFAGIDCRFQQPALQSMSLPDPPSPEQQHQQPDKDNTTTTTNNNTDDGLRRRRLVWSQALVAVLERTPSLVQLVDQCRRVLELPPEPRFAAPLRQPHVSLLYADGPASAFSTNDDVVVLESTVNSAFSFCATQLELWDTTPTSVEGVGNWRRVATLQLDTTTTDGRTPQG